MKTCLASGFIAGLFTTDGSSILMAAMRNIFGIQLAEEAREKIALK